MTVLKQGIEIITSDGIVEIRYYDLPDDQLYRSWKMPDTITEELVSVWRTKNKGAEAPCLPIEISTKLCKIAIREKYIEVKSLDRLGRSTMTGWIFPKDVLEALACFSPH